MLAQVERVGAGGNLRRKLTRTLRLQKFHFSEPEGTDESPLSELKISKVRVRAENEKFWLKANGSVPAVSGAEIDPYPSAPKISFFRAEGYGSISLYGFF